MLYESTEGYGPSDSEEHPQGAVHSPSTDRVEYKYDLCHRRIAKIDRQSGERTEYIWDCRDRLREVRLPDGRKARYFYDAFGRRVRKEVTPNPAPAIAELNALGTPTVDQEHIAAADIKPEDAFGASLVETLQQLAVIGQEVAPRITRFLWDGDELAAELDSETCPRGHVHYPGTFVPLLQIEGGEILVVVTDQLGTPRDLLGGDGTVRWSAAYTAWGKIREEYVADTQGPRGPPATSERQDARRVRSPFRLLGQYHDEETGLSATRYRMWEADTGRWLSPDPLGHLGGMNLVGFDGCPTVDADPLGLVCVKKAAKITPKNAKVIVLGEGMGRVKQAVRALRAQGLNARWYQAWGKNFPKPGVKMTPAQMKASLARNEAWLRSKIAQGYTIFDIGPEPGRPAAFKSPFYALEQSIIASTGYPTTPLSGF